MIPSNMTLFSHRHHQEEGILNFENVQVSDSFLLHYSFRELLRSIGVSNFRTIVSNFAEDMNPLSFDSPSAYCLSTAVKKAEDVIYRKGDLLVTANNNFRSILISSDTVVAINGIVLEKPKDKLHALSMLQMLSGNTHSVHTAVTIYQGSSGSNFTLAKSFVEITNVSFIELTTEDIMAYIETGEPMDKAGGYGIQGQGGMFVNSISGDYFNVVGLPICRLSREIASTIE